jgi:hypothetical protein
MVSASTLREAVLAGGVGLLLVALAHGEEPPAINPFGPRPGEREDALPGYVELSDGSTHPGKLYLTRDARLRIFDQAEKRVRDIPLRAIQRIDCKVLREWMEKEWRFKENASNVKVYTGRSYPAREYLHTITLRDGRKIHGPLSGIIYVQPDSAAGAKRYLFHKRDKGPVGTSLGTLHYVRTVKLGEDALAEGMRAAKESPGEAGGKKE